MPLSIKSVQAERLARKLAHKTGESLTTAIQKALEERLDRIDRQGGRNSALTAQLQDILRRVDKLPDLDPRSPDEIIGYDEYGLPR
jgi:antitoxin VapB